MPTLFVLIVDDDPKRHQVFVKAKKPSIQGETRILVHVYTFDDAVMALETITFDQIFLDFDLNDYGKLSVGVPGPYGSGEFNGLDIAKHIAELQPYTEVIIHSHNPFGSLEMYNYLRSKQVEVGFEMFWDGIGPVPDYEDAEAVVRSIEDMKSAAVYNEQGVPVHDAPGQKGP
jgi:CheY-like chemotaxis protein